MNSTKTGILSLTKDSFTDAIINLGIPKFRASQVLTWIYRFGISSFSDMTNIPKDLQQKLENAFFIYRPNIAKVSKSKDGTIKFLLQLHDMRTIETVFIPEFDESEENWKRATVCVSCQVGCAVGCKFCNTGYNGFVRNLSADEIIAQFLVVKDYLGVWGGSNRVSNVVFMGMGEPLYNYEAVNTSIANLMLDEKDGLSRRKITLSTSGISNVLIKAAKDLKCRLAISLHAPNDIIRSKIMPINDKHNIKSVLDACREYSKHNEYLPITFEYLLLDGINDSDDSARELASLLKGINAKINIIRFNSWDGCSFKEPSERRVLAFSHTLERAGFEAPIRSRRGEDIMAACGQLATKSK